MYMNKNGRLELALALGLVLSVALTGFGSFSRVCGQIRGQTLRLHIRAAGDEAADQQDKLAVRDAVLETAGELFGPAQDLAQAQRLAGDNLPTLQAAAQSALQKRGVNETVRVYLTEMYFATCRYEGFTMPAGKYRALRVDIGPARGKNWWCVLFPQLCLPAAGERADRLYTGEERAVLQSGYEVRFAAEELWQRMWNRAEVYDGC